jgi:PLP dependent protein
VNAGAPLPIEQLEGDAAVAELRRRWAGVHERIATVTDRPVSVIAVSKGHGPAAVRSALAAGITELGESYAQELVAKVAALGDGGPAPSWHFVGRLQRNKVRALVDLVSLWHTVDSPRLADEIARRAPGAQVLVQLDLAGLPGRGGIATGEAPDLVRHCESAGLTVRGLMGVGPPGDSESARPAFASLSNLADRLGLEQRCMGRSGDLEVAVAEGSTMVRVGTDLFGRRPTRDTVE